MPSGTRHVQYVSGRHNATVTECTRRFPEGIPSFSIPIVPVIYRLLTEFAEVDY